MACLLHFNQVSPPSQLMENCLFMADLITHRPHPLIANRLAGGNSKIEKIKKKWGEGVSDVGRGSAAGPMPIT